MSNSHFTLQFSPEANSQLEDLENCPDKKNICKAVHKTLGFMETNLRHPSLRTHQYSRIKGRNGEKVFESYAQNNTPGAYRIFWHYGPGKDVIFILLIIPHP